MTKIIPSWLTEVRPTTPNTNTMTSTWTLPNTDSLLNGSNHVDSVFNTSFTTGNGALSASPDQTRAVVVGREGRLLKILNVSDNEITEELKVRVENKFNSNDVKWGNNLTKSKIATAASNGSIVIWDIENGRSKIDQKIDDHKRAVNRICFSPLQGSSLLSASQDCTMKLWDLRDLERAMNTFQGRCEGVRDVQFNSMNQYEFAAAFDNGTIQKWDIRKPVVHLRKYNAHIGSVLSIDWSFDGRIIASGGRDKIIRIWDMNSESRKPKDTIYTMSGISYIRWRPNYPNEIASCSSLTDVRVFVWNVKRPYIASCFFETHEEVPTGILWHDPDVLWSCSKDKYFIQQYIKGSRRPLDLLSKCGIGWSVYDQLAFTVDKSNNNNDIIDDHRNIRQPLNNQIKKMQRRISPGAIDSSNEGYYKLQQKTGMAHFKAFDYRAFSYLAGNYMISSQNIWEACEHNAKIAHDAQKFRTAQTWKIVQLLLHKRTDSIDNNSNNQNGVEEQQQHSNESNLANENSSNTNTPIEKTSERETGALDNPKKFTKLSEKDFICGPTIKINLTPLFDQEQIISQLLDYYSEQASIFNYSKDKIYILFILFVIQGDVQMCVTLVLVIGDRIKFNNERVEQWFFSYIDETLDPLDIEDPTTMITAGCNEIIKEGISVVYNKKVLYRPMIKIEGESKGIYFLAIKLS
ncbi:4492_t:CDS:10 [Entrophospora sp. SA101]|nr:4492_t:CDS:10 [Entrophospora sp. SA101]